MARQSLDVYLRQLDEIGKSLDPSETAVSFDGLSDTLMVHFRGYGVPGVSIPLGDGWMIRVHRDTDEVIGIQVEGVLANAALKYPFLLDVLAIADITDFEPDPIEQTRRKVAAGNSDRTLRQFVRNLPPLAMAG